MFSPSARPQFYSWLSNLHKDKASCREKDLHLHTFNMAACELRQHISATEGCVRTSLTRQILMIHDQQEATDSHFENCRCFR